MLAPLMLVLALLIGPTPVQAHEAGNEENQRLPALGAAPDLAGWSFLTGDLDAVRKTALGYGVVVLPAADEEIDHNTLTTLIDRHGTMRVQYIGSRFDPEEFRHDLLDLVNEP